MSIKVSTRMVDGVVIVDLFGQLRLGEGTSRLRQVVQELLAEGYRKLLLNMENVLHVDSSGIGELMGCYTSVKNSGGQLKLLQLHKNVRNLLEVTRLYSIFDTYEDLPSAVRAFS
ncbi:MAG: STAS domain-containing protein [Candidatus Korobacteraceae bacterium]